ncbi:MAG: OmpA family protein [Cognatishimia sp.]|nr:OmpA family protein [Cognatishimia sp.]
MLIETLGAGLAKLPNDMVISGHTDAVPFANQTSYDNWDLSSDRANAMRRVVLQSGVTQDRILRVSGLADTQLLMEDAPKDPSNRRIEVLLAYQKADVPEGAKAMATETIAAPGEEVAPVQAAAEMAKEETMAVEAPKASVVEEILPVKPAETVLDEQVFENLRSALR